HKIPEQIAVVAGDFDDETLRAEREFASIAFGCLPRVLEHRIGERRKVEVFRKQFHRWNEVGDLEQPTGRADEQPQRKARFGFIQVLRTQKIVRQRLPTEVEDQSPLFATAGTALEAGVHPETGRVQATRFTTAAALKASICPRLKPSMSGFFFA